MLLRMGPFNTADILVVSEATVVSDNLSNCVPSSLSQSSITIKKEVFFSIFFYMLLPPPQKKTPPSHFLELG
jgi:hypothetical protein